MAEKAKIARKNSRKKPVKKEVEIPILVLDSKKTEEAPRERAKVFGNTENAAFIPTIRKDENDLPVFSAEGGSASGGESITAVEEEFTEEGAEEETAKIIRQMKELEKGQREESEKKIVAKRISAWSPAKKKVVMWASVATFAVVIFLVWISVLGKNLSFDLGSNSYTYFREATAGQGVGQSFENIKSEWTGLEQAIQEETSAPAVDDTVGKLQEKILVEEMKNKLENQ